MHYDYADRKNGRKPVDVLPHRRRGGARRHLRADDLPGVGHAGEPALRRLLAGRGRQPAQGVRQEEARPDGPGAGQVRGRLRGHRLRPRARHPAVRHHRELRRLRLRQEPQLRLRPHHLPDRLPEGPLSGRVPRGAADQREVHAGEGGGLPQRVPPARHPGAGARREPLLVGLRAGRWRTARR